MGNKEVIRQLYFEEKLNTSEIGRKLQVSRQAVTQSLKLNWSDDYEREKKLRRELNKKKHLEETKKIIYLNRKLQKARKVSETQYEYDCIKKQHIIDVKIMSRTRKLSQKDMVLYNTSAYKISKDNSKLVCIYGKDKPSDLPKSLKLKLFD